MSYQPKIIVLLTILIGGCAIGGAEFNSKSDLKNVSPVKNLS